METTNYYSEIKRLAKETGRYQSTFDNFLSLCQQYYWKWLIRNNMKSADTVLKYCMDKDAQRVQKKKKTLEKENLKERLELEDKLYLEFLWEIGDRYYPNQNMLDVITGIKGEENIHKCFTEKPGNFYTAILTIKQTNEFEKYDYIWKRQDYSNIHKSMDSARKALDTPVPSIEESVERVIAQERLEKIKSALEAGRVEIALFTVAPITRALYNGDYGTHIYDDKKKKTVYFNAKCEYNFVQLSMFIDNTKVLLSRYDDTMADLESYRSTFR